MFASVGNVVGIWHNTTIVAAENVALRMAGGVVEEVSRPDNRTTDSHQTCTITEITSNNGSEGNLKELSLVTQNNQSPRNKSSCHRELATEKGAGLKESQKKKSTGCCCSVC